jgi:hypothetical protein
MMPLVKILTIFLVVFSQAKMTNTKGYRRGTRYMFSRKFRTKGMTPLSTFMVCYKRGDIVDIKVWLKHSCVHSVIKLLVTFRVMELNKRECLTNPIMEELAPFTT